MNLDTDTIEKIKKLLQDKTGKEIDDRVSELHKRSLGDGLAFKIEPINSTFIYIVFKQAFFKQNETRCSELVEKLAYKIDHICVGMPHVIKIDSEVHGELPFHEPHVQLS